MIDPTGLRAAAARAREAGGVVRAVSELADLVEQFCDQYAAPNPEPGYQWRIVIDGDPGRRPPHIGCWIDVVDGDFQNLNVVGRLEFRAKPVDAAPRTCSADSSPEPTPGAGDSR